MLEVFYQMKKSMGASVGIENVHHCTLGQILNFKEVISADTGPLPPHYKIL